MFSRISDENLVMGHLKTTPKPPKQILNFITEWWSPKVAIPEVVFHYLTIMELMYLYIDLLFNLVHVCGVCVHK